LWLFVNRTNIITWQKKKSFEKYSEVKSDNYSINVAVHYKTDSSSSRILLGHADKFDTLLEGAKQEVRMEFSWKILWTLSNRLTYKKRGKN
jgi:hypothetical protein